ncbi:MAG: hypothetical protein KDK91_13460 [Gammaproteobacteria bacterium]|nr:hypothetical protein [Gammaproteobacteria bacterium]
MRLHRNQIWTRLLGTLTGLGFLAIGAYALLGGGAELTEVQIERARGFGWVACIGGLWAVAVSWLARDLSGIWCRPPRKGLKPQR